MWQGIAALAAASLLLGIIPSLNKLILLGGMNSGSMVFFNYLTVMAVTGIVIALRRQSFRVTGKQLAMLLFTGALGLGATGFLLNLAYDRIPVGLATMLHFLYPTVVSVVMVLVFHQKLTRDKGKAILLSLAGMLLIADFSGGMDPAGMAAALLSGMTYAYYMIANEKGCINELPLTVKLFYVSMGCALCFGTWQAASGTLTVPQSAWIWFLLIGLVGVGSAAAFYLVTVGIQKIGASAASFINMLEPVTSMAAGALLYRDLPGGRAMAGCLLVLGSVFFIAMDGKRKE